MSPPPDLCSRLALVGTIAPRPEPTGIELAPVVRDREATDRSRGRDLDRGGCRRSAPALGREIEQPLETVAVGHSHEVDEVAGFGTFEKGEQLVDGELFAGQQRKTGALFDRERSRVATEVNLGPVLAVFHEQPGKARVVDRPLDVETVVEQCLLRSGDKPIDDDGARAEEVEIPSSAVDVASDDEYSATGQGEALNLGQRCDDSRDALL